MVKPMRSNMEMQAMVNGDGDTANEFNVKGLLISKSSFLKLKRGNREIISPKRS